MKSKSKSNPKRKSVESRSAGSLGCGYIALTGILMILLLVANMMFVRAFFSANFSGLDDRFFQASQFMLPIIMIFIEYWLYDAFRARQRRNRSRRS